MSAETQLMALIDEGNPVPAPRELKRQSLDAAAYLATLETRSSDMTKTEERQAIPEQPTPRRWLPLVAAAVLIIVVGVVIVLLSGSETEAPPATDAPVTTDLEGSWTSDGYDLTFEGDEYTIIKPSEADEIAEGGFDIWDTGAFEVIEDVVLFTTSRSPVCRTGETGEYGLDSSGDDVVGLTFVQDDCGFSRLSAGRISLTRVED